MLRAVLVALLAALAAVPAAQPLRTAPASGDFFAALDALSAESPQRLGASVPDGFYLEPVAGGFAAPVGTAFLPDGRMLVIEKLGRLSLVAGGPPEVILNLTAEVLAHGDRGLLGVAVDPAFAQNGHVYLSYTVSVDGREMPRTDAFGRVTRYTLDAAGAVVVGSRRVLIGETFASGIPTCYFSHAIGTLAFGRDGSLFVGTGDAASYNTVDTGGLYPDCFGAGRFPQSEDVGAFRSQRVESLAGKILRIDPATGLGYPSNPFYTGNAADAASKVWALGFRNPFRFTVDPASGDAAAGDPGVIYYGDVGWGLWEEVGVVRRGQNMGWPCYEGSGVQSASGSYPNSALGRQVCPGLAATPPAFEWHHRNASLSRPPGRRGSTAVGGAVYRGTRYPAEYRGRMFYSDYARGWVASALVGADGALSGDALFLGDAGPIVDLSYDAFTQNLYLTNVYTGTVQRLRHTAGDANSMPVAIATATPTQGSAPLGVQFTGAGSSDPDAETLSYAWDFGNGAASTLADAATVYTSPGDYTARLTVTDARGATATATVAITVRPGTPPTAEITSPAAGASVLSGQTITLAATGADADPGQTATLTYAWAVTLVHETHEHPGAFAATGPAATYTVPFHGDAGEAYGLLIRLTVTDATGFRTVAERSVTIGDAGGETDVTDAGTPVALVTAPTGDGSRSLEILRDGVTPAPQTGAPAPALAALQYDTFYGGEPRATDWIGYTFTEPLALARVRFHEGLQFENGGWFGTLGVEVRVGGTWIPAAGLVASPAYRGADGQHFDAYDLAFTPVAADGVRVVGTPGGAARFVSASEIRVFSSASAVLDPLPAPWASADVGPPYGAGSAGVLGSTFTVRGGGDIWGDLDHFHYAWQPLSGDGTLTARLTGLAAANPWAKAGLMIRTTADGTSTAGDAAHAMLVATPGNGVHLQYRRTAGGQTEWQPGPAQTIPTWLRLQRTGTVASAFVSSDGQTWSFVGSATVPFGETVLVGLMSTSTDYAGRNDLAAATFTNVALTRPSASGPRADVTGEGTPVVSVAEPQGGGSRSPAVIRDGVAPAPTTTFPADLTVQYDTFVPGTDRATDFVGYTFAAPRPLVGLRLTEGAHSDNGGWFETLGVEVRVGGAWIPAESLTVAPAYPAVNDSRHFDAYDLAFTPVTADGVRIAGRPGGSSRFVSVAELRAFGPAGSASLPDGWTSADIGDADVAGSTVYASGRFTLRGNGDLWGDADRFQFAHQTLQGNGSVTARLVSVDGENPWAKVGVMIRAGTGASAPHAMIIGTPGRGVHFQYRTALSGDTGWQAGSDAQRAPVWLRVQRTGALFTGEVSPDGQTWATVGQATIAMPDAILVGLVSASTDFTGRGDLATAVFEDVAIGGPAQFDRPAEVAVRTTPTFGIESVFPNPTRGAVSVRVGIAARGTYRVEMLDVLGRRVYASVLREDAPIVRTLPIDLGAYGAGVYVLRMFDEGGNTVSGRVTVVR